MTVAAADCCKMKRLLRDVTLHETKHCDAHRQSYSGIGCHLQYAYVHTFLFGPKRNEVTREWRKLHNEELNDVYFSPNIVRVIKARWAGHVAR